jgi:hypothetical protein
MPKRPSVSSVDPKTTVAQAALRLLAKEEWGRLTLAAIARAGKIPLRDVVAIAPSKTAISGLILRMLMHETARLHNADSASADPRERLFDVTMTWFDVQQSHATALKRLYRALRYDPATVFALRGDALDVAGELIALAEADFGLSARLQAAVFAGVLARAVAAWRGDDEQMGKTMAQLDADLRRVGRFLWPKPGNAGVPSASPKARKSGRDGRGPGKRKYNS